MLKLENQIPEELLKVMSETINKGYANPSKRVSYRQWENAIQGLEIIEYFECDKSRIEQGGYVKLHWKVNKSCKKLTLSFNGIILNDIKQSEYSVKVYTNTTFKLIAIGKNNKKVRKEVRIHAIPKPNIIEFKSEPQMIMGNEPVVISWKVENAQQINIDNGIGKVNLVGQQKIYTSDGVIYKITAIGEFSSVTKEIAIRIFPTPLIESMFVPMPDFESKISLDPVQISAPQIDVSISMPGFDMDIPDFNMDLPNYNFNLPDFNMTTPKFIEPSDELLKHIHPKVSIFNLAKIYEYIKFKTTRS
ncbi:hypothetical protein AGMMS49574_01860 [Bacteroidia bacterium]|nr:hypothetical protein AGMMS49574_01860 [Bacteroidia bacterium]